jgi:hypothetical protein
MPPSNAKKSAESPLEVPVSRVPVGNGELVLHGDVSGLTNAFVGRPRHLVTCPIPDSIYLKIHKHQGGVSRFFEDAVAAYDGDLSALVEAAVLFVDTRRVHAATDPPKNASGRVLPSTFAKIRQIEAALAGIRGMSRAKVLAGLIQLRLQ